MTRKWASGKPNKRKPYNTIVSWIKYIIELFYGYWNRLYQNLDCSDVAFETFGCTLMWHIVRHQAITWSNAINWNPGNHGNTSKYINAFENVVCKMAFILAQSQFVEKSQYPQLHESLTHTIPSTVYYIAHYDMSASGKTAWTRNSTKGWHFIYRNRGSTLLLY